jgi:hypothetical protein
MKSHAAFTLVDLLIAMAILAMLVSFVVPKLLQATQKPVGGIKPCLTLPPTSKPLIAANANWMAYE